ncbi:ester cyclase [Planctomycetota bacterium]
MYKISLITALAMVVVLTGCQSQGDLEARNLATLHRYFKEIVNHGDHSKHDELISPDFTLYYAGEPDETKGIELFIQMEKENVKSFSKIEIIEDESVAEGNKIATQWHGIAIHDRGPAYGFEVIPDDKELIWHGTAFYTFDKNGLITQVHILSNMDEVLRSRAERAAKQGTVVSSPKPSPEMKKLAVFVGDWVYEGEQVDSPLSDLFGEAGSLSGIIEARFVLDGSYLETKWEDKNPAGITKIIEITGYDPTEKSYVANGYVSDGSRDTTVQTTSSDGRIWTSRKTFTDSNGKEVLLKCILTFSTDWRSYISTEEYSVDGGKTWMHWYKFEATRVSRH